MTVTFACSNNLLYAHTHTHTHIPNKENLSPVNKQTNKKQIINCINSN